MVYRAPDLAEVLDLTSARLGHGYEAHKAQRSKFCSWPKRKTHQFHLNHPRAFPRAQILTAQTPPSAVGLPVMQQLRSGLIGHTSDRPARHAGGASLAARLTRGRKKGVSCAVYTGLNASSLASPQKPRHIREQLRAAAARGPTRRLKGPVPNRDLAAHHRPH